MSTLIGRPGQEHEVDYLALAASQGYRVDDPNGRVGTVDGVVAGAWSDRPDAIEVRVGLFRPAVLMVGAEAVADQYRHLAVPLDPDRVVAGPAQPELGPAAHITR